MMMTNITITTTARNAVTTTNRQRSITIEKCYGFDYEYYYNKECYNLTGNGEFVYSLPDDVAVSVFVTHSLSLHECQSIFQSDRH
jgi:hypothetical protein